jgi:hypothetical protein
MEEPITWDQLDGLMQELRGMARALLALEGNAQSLQQPTALVLTALRRQVPGGTQDRTEVNWNEITWPNRKYFFGAMYKAMWRALRDHARGHKNTGFDLRSVSWGDGSSVPSRGTNLVILGTANNGLLHIRIFDAGGNLITDTDETRLPDAPAEAITALKQQLPGLLPPYKPSGAEKTRLLAQARSIVSQTHNQRWGRSVQIEEIHLENLARSADERPEQIEALYIALDRLRGLNPDWAGLIEHHYLAGYSWEEAGRVMGLSDKTARRHGERARLVLAREICKILNEEDITSGGPHGAAADE